MKAYDGITPLLRLKVFNFLILFALFSNAIVRKFYPSNDEGYFFRVNIILNILLCFMERHKRYTLTELCNRQSLCAYGFSVWDKGNGYFCLTSGKQRHY